MNSSSRSTVKILSRDAMLCMLFAACSLALYFLPTGFEERINARSSHCRAVVLGIEDDIQQFGMVRKGSQDVTMRLMGGLFEGREVTGENRLLGMMDRDKVFRPGDTVLAVVTTDASGDILRVVPQAHYRLGLEAALAVMFAVLLLAFGGWTGAKALLSFAFAGLCLWKVLVPGLLRGWDPILLSLGVTAALTAAIVFLVAGPTRKGVTAFCGAILGVLTSCVLASYFTSHLHLNGAVMPFAQTLLYSGFGHLNLTGIYQAAVFLAASGAVMDLAMDVAAAQQEVAMERPDMSRWALLRSGIRVGRAVVGTMTTTLLLAYSGGYITLLMAFMAQGVPVANLLNLVYVAAEVQKTLVGSFGLVTVAPFTALVGALVLPVGRKAPAGRPSERIEMDKAAA